MKIREGLTYKHYHQNGDKDVCLVLHGGAAGIESPFISQIFASLSDSRRSVFAYNIPYCERGDESASENLEEEVAVLESVLNSLRAAGYERITIIAKSLGAIVVSFYLEKEQAADLEAVVLGYVIGDMKTAAITPNLKLVIQGEKDRFGNGKAVRDEIGQAPVEIMEVEGADHSYRNAALEPEYQQAVIRMLLEKI